MRRALVALIVAAGTVLPFAAPADAATPATIWSKTVPGTPSAPDTGGGRVYIGFTKPSGKGAVRALDAATGRTLWTRGVAGPVTAPVDYVNALGTVFVAATTGSTSRVYALDAATGKVRGSLQRIPAANVRGVEHDPTSGLVFLTTSDGRSLLPVRADLKRHWPARELDTGIVIEGGYAYYIDDVDDETAAQNCLHKVVLSTSLDEVDARCPLIAEISDAGDGGLLLRQSLSASDGEGVWRVDPASLDDIWYTEEVWGRSVYTSTLGGRVGVTGAAPRFSLLSGTDGSLICSAYPAGLGGFQQGPIWFASDGSAYAGGKDRTLLKFDAACNELWRITLPGPLRAAETTSNRIVVLAGTTLTMYQ